MLASYSSEIEDARLHRLFHATCLSLGIAWKLAVSVLALAIMTSIVAGPAAPSDRLAADATQRLRVKEYENHVRVATQLPAGHNTLRVELVDPHGTKHLTLTYGKERLISSFTNNNHLMRIGYTVTHDGGEVLNIRTPGADYRVGVHATGDSYVLVEDSTKNRTPLGHLHVSPEGKRVPTSENPNHH
ncbi:hypothetical protein V5E97_18315 [Singulisphaera sp. Ch08]|uniref:Uncharacterized protein n=1 Tax=Singulisphaera sp. Ch08 TaxID=3120278 RepID=A0AAU7CR52_9BACT